MWGKALRGEQGAARLVECFQRGSQRECSTKQEGSSYPLNVVVLAFPVCLPTNVLLQVAAAVKSSRASSPSVTSSLDEQQQLGQQQRQGQQQQQQQQQQQEEEGVAGMSTVEVGFNPLNIHIKSFADVALADMELVRHTAGGGGGGGGGGRGVYIRRSGQG